MRPIKVSVCVITYNHGAFIRQALESALAQEVDFPYEIVVGDDCSSDGTREVILELQRLYPRRIRALLSERNVGGRNNFMRTLDACRSEYVALLDGDDYWTSPRKLQVQADFLDANRDYAIVFHDALAVEEGGERSAYRYCEPDQPQTSGIADLLEGNFIPACSTMFRRDGRKMPDWFSEALFGDWPLHILNARNGKIGYINEVMSVYRLHGAGLSHDWPNPQYFAGTAVILAHVRDEIDAGYEPILRGTLSRLWLNVFFPAHEATLRMGTRQALQDAFEHWPAAFPLSPRQRKQLLAQACVRLASASVRAHRRARAGAWLARALRQDLASAGHWGFWSLAAEICGGHHVSESLRITAKWTVHGSRRFRGPH